MSKSNAQLAQDILNRLAENNGRVCLADRRDLRKIAGTWPKTERPQG